MKNFVKISSLAVSLFSASLFSSSASAVIIEGNFRGVIEKSYGGDPLVTPVWDNVALGDEVFGSFWYDTDKAPQKAPTSTDLYVYSDSDEWMGSSFTIGGKTYSSSDYAKYDGNLSAERIFLTSLTPIPYGSSREVFYLADLVGKGDFAKTYTQMVFVVQIVSQDAPLINGLNLVQNFDWYDVGDPTSDAFADVSIAYSRKGKVTASSANIDIREFHIGIKKPVNLPEPSPFILLLMGAFALALKARANSQ